MLQVAAPPPGEPYTDGGPRLLAALAPQVAVVVRALELAEALEAERDRVRRRHPRRARPAPPRPARRARPVAVRGRAGPAGARRRASPPATQPARAAAGADPGTRSTPPSARSAGSSTDLRPAALDDAGLRGRRPPARRRAGRRRLAGRGSTAAELPPLPPDVETAAYRIVAGGADQRGPARRRPPWRRSPCGADGALQVTVADDGRGVAADAAARASGWPRCGSRAEALGGTLASRPATGGTTVVATLPLGEARP